MLSNIIFITFISLIVIYIDWMMTKDNWGAKWNGIGCIDDVLSGNAMLPMRHRVLVPWICKVFKSHHHILTYTILRWISIVFALSMSFLYFDNLLATCLIALFFILAALYDYTDGYIEVGLIALALYLMPTEKGSFAWIMMGVITFLAVINRESGLIIPVIAVLNGTVADAVWCIGFGIFGYIIPRATYQDGERYCPFNMIRENIRRIKERWGKKSLPLYDQYCHFFILSLVIWICYVYGFIDGSLKPFDYLMMVFYFAMLVPSVWMEIRVFSPIMLSVIPLAVRGIN